jgi:hypothetical protein
MGGLGVLSVLGLLACAAAQCAEVTTPEQFFGFKLGTDKKLARYDKIVEYLQKLAGQSDRVRVQNLGPTTLGNPYILVEISSPENLKNLGHYKSGSERESDRLATVMQLSSPAEPRGTDVEHRHPLGKRR